MERKEDVINRIDRIRAYYEKIKVESCPARPHSIQEADEYLKGRYFKMLGALSLYHKNTPQEQSMFLRRLINDIRLDGNIEEWIRKAMEIEVEDIEEFLSQFRESRHRFAFVLDAMLLTGISGEYDDAQTIFLAELIELLNLEKEEVSFLSRLALSVLEQNTEKYTDLHGLRLKNLELKDFLGYTKEYVQGLLMDEGGERHYYSARPALLQLSETAYANKNYIFENLIFNTAEEWKFESCESVKFINCDFTGIGRGKLSFQGVKKLEMKNCRVKNFTQRFAGMSGLSILAIRESQFIDCSYRDSRASFGGVLGIEDNAKVSISLIRNEFFNCSIQGDYLRGSNGAVLGVQTETSVAGLEVIENKFADCNVIASSGGGHSLINIKQQAKFTVERNEFAGGLQKLFSE